eukprot:882282-Rhodomonas_salina.1
MAVHMQTDGSEQPQVTGTVPTPWLSPARVRKLRVASHWTQDSKSRECTQHTALTAQVTGQHTSLLKSYSQRKSRDSTLHKSCARAHFTSPARAGHKSR